jgi:hypothetical protein
MRIYLTLLFSFLLSISYAQKGMIKGSVIDEKTRKPIAEALVTIKVAKVATSTSTAGKFSISNLKYGDYDVTVAAEGYQDFETNVSVDKGVTQLGEWEMIIEAEKANDVTADANQAGANQAVADEDVSGGGAQNVGSALNASRDPFNNAAQFSWGQFFFKQRGYENEHNVTYLNGIPMVELEDGGTAFNSWAGLNDVFRSRSLVVGLATNDVTYGGLGNTATLDASASVQRKQTRVTYSNTNRSYRNRLMLTHSTGVMKNGWAFSFSASRRWAQQGPIQGTFYDAYGYFAAAEKRIKNHSIGIIAVGAPTRRAKSGTAMQEVFDLTGNNLYSPNWGYQNGKVRSARVLNQFIPLFVLTDDITLKNNGKILASVSYQTGKISNSILDFYNSQNSQPDYYRNLPSFIALDMNPGAAAEVAAAIKADPSIMQIKWDEMYEANKNTVYNIAGVSGNRSKYILGADVEQQTRLNGAVNYEQVINPHTTIYAGVNYANQSLQAYRQVEDLLGGAYWYNVNQFAERTFIGLEAAGYQDLNETNRVKVVGDKYGYNYKMSFAKTQTWAQAAFTFNKVDFFVAGNFANTNYQRDGISKVGLYADNSFGKSVKQIFNTFGVKGGATYKINGRNYLYANAATGNSAPLYDNVFVSPRTRNETTAKVTTEKMQSFEAGYLLRTPTIKARVTVFATDITDASDIKRFFDPINFSLANMSITGINKRYNGLEIGAEFKASSTISITTATSLTQAFYTSRPLLNAYIDNDTTVASGTGLGGGELMYAKNLRLPNGPQTAFNLGAMYRSPKFWMLGVTFNYLAENYIDFAPNKHVSSYLDLLNALNPEAYAKFTTQQKLNPFYTVDVNFNKSWRATKFIKQAPSRSLFFVNIGINNILNNKNIQLLGFEQLRSDNTKPTLFDAKYSYALGIQYFVNLAYSF